jgi:hypothetical protein
VAPKPTRPSMPAVATPMMMSGTIASSLTAPGRPHWHTIPKAEAGRGRRIRQTNKWSCWRPCSGPICQTGSFRTRTLTSARHPACRPRSRAPCGAARVRRTRG